MGLTSSRIFFRSTAALLVVGLLALLGIIGVSLWLSERAQVYFDEVTSAREARTAVVELRNALQTAESSQRGFIITGNEIYLAPFDVAKTLVERLRVDTRQRFASYSDLSPLLERMDIVVEQKLHELDNNINLKRERRDADALASFSTNRGKALMDEANVLFSGATRAADSRLIASIAEHRLNTEWLRYFTIAGGLVIVLVVGAASIAVVRFTRELDASRNEVASLNFDLEQRVENRTAQLIQANAEVQRFAYIVTHDLRAPLVNIMGFTTELERGVQSMRNLMDRTDISHDMNDPVARDAELAASEELPEAIGFIRASTKKMDSLINAILRISREGGRALKPERVNLRELASASVQVLGHQLAEADAAVDIDLGVTEIDSDRLSLEHILANLLDNAVKYRARDRALHIRVTSERGEEGAVRLRVEDNGRGIAENDLERIFELFRRAGSQDQAGEGIGLAYVRTLARRLGGDVTVASQVGKGTLFEIMLPARLGSSEGIAA